MSCFLALKLTENLTKVRNKTLCKYNALFQKQAHILDKLRTRSGMSEKPTVGNDDVFVGLQDYVKLYGNPIMSGQELCQGLVGDQFVVMVRTHAQAELVGRHSLRGVVNAAANGLDSQVIKHLSGLSVDNLEVSRLVSDLVTEYSCRQRWRRHVNLLEGGRDRCEQSTSHRSAASVASSRLARPVTEATGESDEGDQDDEEGEEEEGDESESDNQSAFAGARSATSPAASAMGGSPWR